MPSTVREADRIADYFNDAEAALRAYYGGVRGPKFLLMSRAEVEAELAERLDELDVTCSFSLLASAEAALKADYRVRCERRLEDVVSREFRDLYKRNGSRIHLDSDILDVWKRAHPNLRHTIGEFRAAFRYRNWIAHGRQFTMASTQRYAFIAVFELCEAVVTSLPLVSER